MYETAYPCSRPSEEKCLRAETCQLAAPGLPATAGAEPLAGVPPSSSKCAAASPALLKIPVSLRRFWAALRSCLVLRAAGAGDFSSSRHEILRAKLHSSVNAHEISGWERGVCRFGTWLKQLLHQAKILLKPTVLFAVKRERENYGYTQQITF